MMGLPNLPKKLPSRNWMIFWTVLGTFSAAIIYDKREKKRATARWAKAVSHLAKEPISSPSEMPRKLTIYLESPPTDGLRVAQDHYTEYIKPILAASGLDWEFVQGRKEGDVRAAVAERIRRTRDPSITAGAQTQDEVVQEVRKRNRTPEYTGIGGDVVIGRHTWKEYVRGLHEGWLGPLTPPPAPVVQEPVVAAESAAPAGEGEPKEGADAEEKKPEEKKPEEKKPEEKKPERPPQPPPYNSVEDYATSSIPMIIPAEFSPSAPITFPHLLGFTNTPIRLGRFLNRRHLADEIGREVAAACLATARQYREEAHEDDTTEPEQVAVLAREEKDWPKSVWKEATKPKEEEENKEAPKPPAEKIWTKPVVLDTRIATRMRRFELQADDEARARAITVPEEEIEGWIKGHLRGLWRWVVTPEPKWQPPVVEE
ncbi:mitochondrial import inner membrane translocase subunit Tim54 [Poronia punctata]|nr:mitochondrial import inner membrane translocase subunit Tim54 [Poronia punctata]